MNDLLRDRLAEHLDPEHKCAPDNAACEMPAYVFHFAAPAYIAQWPEFSAGREKLEDIHELNG